MTAKVVISVIVIIFVAWVISLGPARTGADVHTFFTHLAHG